MKFGAFLSHLSSPGVDDERIRCNDKSINSHATLPWKTVISRNAQELRIMNAIHFMHVSE